MSQKFAFLALGLFAALRLLAQEPARGQVTPWVACKNDAAYSYALYLPSNYTPDKKWPVVFGFDPGGVGERPVRFLEKAAEAYGYIVMGSWNSRNGPEAPILASQKALWKEAQARYSIDPQRAYAVGFSGGSRAAVRMALDRKEHFAGVLCCGGFLPGGVNMPKTLPFSVYAIVGTQDWALFEIYQMNRDLSKAGTPHWMELFVGRHEWPKAELGGEGMEFFQVCAMRRGQIPRDDALLARLVQARLASAAVLKASGALVPALWKYRETAGLFQGVPGADEAARSAEAMEQDPQVKARMDMESRLDDQLTSLRRRQTYAEYERELPGLEKLAQGEGWEADRARWALTVAAADLDGIGQLSLFRSDFYLSAQVYELACRLDPSRPAYAYNAACAYAHMDRKKEAFAWLRKAVSEGFKDAALMEKDADLERLRKEPEFRQILQSLVPASTGGP